MHLIEGTKITVMMMNMLLVLLLLLMMMIIMITITIIVMIIIIITKRRIERRSCVGRSKRRFLFVSLSWNRLASL